MAPTHRLLPIEVTLPSYGVFVLESHHAPGFRMAEQCHPFLEIFYVLGGTGAFHIDGLVHSCHADDVVVVPVGQVHRIEDDPADPLALYGICVAAQVWRHEPAVLEHLPAGRLPVGALVGAQVRADLRRLLFEQTLARLGGRLQILGLTHQFLAVLARTSLGEAHPRAAGRDETASGYQLAVKRYVAQLPHRFFEATDLDQTAAELGMSRRRFTHLFRGITGTSWHAYLARLRIDYACQLLRDTGRSIIGIAFECGYEDLSSFYRAFKHQTGLPPRAWRQNHANLS